MAETALTTLAAIRTFILAGNAYFTLVSKLTGNRKTFNVRLQPVTKERPLPCYFVKLLTGSENSADESYRYLGFMYVDEGEPVFRMNENRHFANACAAFEWLIHFIDDPIASAKFFEQSEFWHAGRCGKCGRMLTDPESIARGIGPTCAGV
jgi:hypothetical protein